MTEIKTLNSDGSYKLELSSDFLSEVLAYINGDIARVSRTNPMYTIAECEIWKDKKSGKHYASLTYDLNVSPTPA